MADFFDIGDLLKVTATFTDPDTEAPIDPTTVHLSVKKPSGEVENFTYNEGAEIVKDDVGVYHSLIDLTESGRWTYRWFSTGTGQAAEEGSAIVRELQTQ